MTGCPPLPHCLMTAVATVCPFGMSTMNAIVPLRGKLDLLNSVSRSHQHGVLFKRQFLEVRSEQCKI